MNTEEYLKRNELLVYSGIRFTIGDLVFLRKNNFSSITINGYKPTSEILTEKDIILRLNDLANIVKEKKLTARFDFTHEKSLDLLKGNLKSITKDFNLDFVFDILK